MMGRRGGIGILLVATVMLFVVTACTSKKKLVSPTAQTEWRWMTAKMNGTLLVEGEETGFTGTLRMRCDSAVWISVSAFLGVESIRTLVTQDSVTMINRLNQTYLAEPMSTMAEKIHGASLREIQSRLLGNGTDHAELQWGPYVAKIRYVDVQWDEPTTFPIKIGKSYERIKL